MNQQEVIRKSINRLTSARVSRANQQFFLGAVISGTAALVLFVLLRLLLHAWPDTNALLQSLPEVLREIGRAGPEIRDEIKGVLLVVLPLFSARLFTRPKGKESSRLSVFLRAWDTLVLAWCVRMVGLVLIATVVDPWAMIWPSPLPLFAMLLLTTVYFLRVETIEPAEHELLSARKSLKYYVEQLNCSPGIQRHWSVGIAVTGGASIVVTLPLLYQSPDPQLQIVTTILNALGIALPGVFVLSMLKDTKRRSVGRLTNYLFGTLFWVFGGFVIATFLGLMLSLTFWQAKLAWGISTIFIAISALAPSSNRLASYTVRGAYVRLKWVSLLQTAANERKRIAELEELVLHDPGLPAASD